MMLAKELKGGGDKDTIVSGLKAEKGLIFG